MGKKANNHTLFTKIKDEILQAYYKETVETEQLLKVKVYVSTM